jgi:hypothetical protein
MIAKFTRLSFTKMPMKVTASDLDLANYNNNWNMPICCNVAQGAKVSSDTVTVMVIYTMTFSTWN